MIEPSAKMANFSKFPQPLNRYHKKGQILTEKYRFLGIADQFDSHNVKMTNFSKFPTLMHKKINSNNIDFQNNRYNEIWWIPGDGARCEIEEIHSEMVMLARERDELRAELGMSEGFVWFYLYGRKGVYWFD